MWVIDPFWKMKANLELTIVWLLVSPKNGIVLRLNLVCKGMLSCILVWVLAFLFLCLHFFTVTVVLLWYMHVWSFCIISWMLKSDYDSELNLQMGFLLVAFFYLKMGGVNSIVQFFWWIVMKLEDFANWNNRSVLFGGFCLY